MLLHKVNSKQLHINAFTNLPTLISTEMCKKLWLEHIRKHETECLTHHILYFIVALSSEIENCKIIWWSAPLGHLSSESVPPSPTLKIVVQELVHTSGINYYYGLI